MENFPKSKAAAGLILVSALMVPGTVDAAAAAKRYTVKTIGVPILVGAILNGPGPTHRRNVGILWSPTSGPGSEYVKRHPVPLPGRLGAGVYDWHPKDRVEHFEFWQIRLLFPYDLK